jgi:hypothetical protein
VRVLVLVDNPSVLELDVEVLVDGVERAADGQVVLELHRHLLPHELLEVGEEQHTGRRTLPALAPKNLQTQEAGLAPSGRDPQTFLRGK